MTSAYPCTDCVLHDTAPVVCVAPHSPHDDPLFAIVGEAPDTDGPIQGQRSKLLWDEMKEHGLYPSQAHLTTWSSVPLPMGTRLATRSYVLHVSNAELYWLKWETSCRLILAVGTTAFKALGGNGNITQVQGVAYEYEGFTVVPVLHPYGAARSPRRLDEFRRAIGGFARLVKGTSENFESEVALVNALR